MANAPMPARLFFNRDASVVLSHDPVDHGEAEAAALSRLLRAPGPSARSRRGRGPPGKRGRSSGFVSVFMEQVMGVDMAVGDLPVVMDVLVDQVYLEQQLVVCQDIL